MKMTLFAIIVFILLIYVLKCDRDSIQRFPKQMVPISLPFEFGKQ